MRRYAETFFRYWLIAVAPLIALTLVGAVMVRDTPKTVLASADIWVAQAQASNLDSYNQWLTPAQNEASALSQLLQSPSFDLLVANDSPLYTKVVKAKSVSFAQYVVTDLSTGIQLNPRGTNLLTVSYTGQQEPAVATQIVQGFLTAAGTSLQDLSQQQSSADVASYTTQLNTAEAQLQQSSKKLRAYISAHGITPDEVSTQQNFDPTLASLYQQVQSDQSSVAAAQAQLNKAQAQVQASDSGAAAGGFRIQDPPGYTIPSARKKALMNLALYVGIGLLLSVAFIAVKTLMDRSLRYADEVPELLDLPVLAVLPYSTALAGRNDTAPRASRTLAPHGGLADM